MSNTIPSILQWLMQSKASYVGLRLMTTSSNNMNQSSKIVSVSLQSNVSYYEFLKALISCALADMVYTMIDLLFGWSPCNMSCTIPLSVLQWQSVQVGFSPWLYRYEFLPGCPPSSCCRPASSSGESGQQVSKNIFFGHIRTCLFIIHILPLFPNLVCIHTFFLNLHHM